MIGSIIGLMAAAMAAASDGAPTTNAQPADTIPASSAPAPAKIKKVKDPGDKIVCQDVAETGSHLGGVPICKKQREWDAITSASHKLIQDTTRAGLSYQHPGG